MAPQRSTPFRPQNPPYGRFTALLRVRAPKLPIFSAAREFLAQWNELEIPVTWCPFTNDWIPWKLPMRVLKGQKKLVRVAASGFHKIKGLQPPRCPHTFSDPRKSLMTLNLNKTFDDTGARRISIGLKPTTVDAMCSSQIPKNVGLNMLRLKNSMIISVCFPSSASLTLFTMLADSMYSFEDDDGEEDQPSSSQESSSSAREVETYLLHGDPRFPRINDLPPALSGPIQPYFCERVAIARKTVDLELIQFTEEEAGRGSTSRPDLHPLAQTPAHAIMAIYDERVRPGCLIRAFSNLQHIDSHVGRAIREFHSPIGIPADAWTAILHSVYGYNSHVVEGCCSMAPPMNQVALKNVIPPRISVRTYPPHYIVPHQDDFIDTPSGVAFMEWNSRIGVPMDQHYGFDSQFSDSLASTKELIILTRRIGSLFITAWPLSNGRQMISFVLSEGLHMPCFCFRTHGLPYGCEFTVLSERSRDERAYAYCHFDPPRCDFFFNLVDLQKIYLEASYEMEYPTPLLAHFPYGQDLMTSYLTRPTEPLNIGRPIFQPQFFRGFLGDKTDQHFLEENLSVIRTLNSLSLDAGQIGPKHSVPPALPRYISTSIQTENDDPTSEFTDTEKTAIMSLANGSGIAASDFKSLLKKCGVCTKFFLARSLDAHASQCGRFDGPRKLRRN
ncbi:hypothetical protein B0H13DRAFT_1906943 [Mycena leptocephala]|nr:hypothetical protein B0H13DRAFT_1906943 [Mycena leptocephala]